MSKIRNMLPYSILLLFSLFIGLVIGYGIYQAGKEKGRKGLSTEIKQAIEGDKNVSVGKFLIVRIRSHKAIWINKLPFNKGEK